MSELQTLKKQMAATAARYKAAVRNYHKYNEESLIAEEDLHDLEAELDELRSLDFSTVTGKKILAKAIGQFLPVIQAEKVRIKRLEMDAHQQGVESDDQYGLAERIYSRIQQYDDRFRWPTVFEEETL